MQAEIEQAYDSMMTIKEIHTDEMNIILPQQPYFEKILGLASTLDLQPSRSYCEQMVVIRYNETDLLIFDTDSRSIRVGGDR